MTKTTCSVSGQTLLEDRLNSILHGLAALLSVGAFFALTISASKTNDVWNVVGNTVYGLALIFLYVASTLYHSAKNTKRKRKLKVLDHVAIYVMIAGTYTPFTLGPLRGTYGWALFAFIWAFAFAGIVFKLFFTGRFRVVSTLIYLGMGWMGASVAMPLSKVVPMQAIYWILAGGLFYTFGTVFYLAKRIPFHHVLWHLFVIAGSACHFCSIYWYVS